MEIDPENRLCWGKIRDLTRFATPETDGELAREAEGVTAAAVRQMARHHRPPTCDDAQEDHRRRSVRTYKSADGTVLHISGRRRAAGSPPSALAGRRPDGRLVLSAVGTRRPTA